MHHHPCLHQLLLHSHHYHYPSDSHKEGRPEVNLPPRMGLGITLGPRYEVGESSTAAAARPTGGLRVDYDFVATMDRQGAPGSTDTELGAHMREFESMVGVGCEIQRDLTETDWNRHTRLLMETEAGMSREAWGRAMDASDLAHGGVISLRTTVHAQMSEITEFKAVDRTRQQQIIQTLTVMQTLQREMVPLQGLVTTLQGQVTALQGQVMTLQGQVTTLQGQQGSAGGPAQPELPEEAGSSS
ncbi:hypothetical protein Tco_1262046 [Tanacetum coccineum]